MMPFQTWVETPVAEAVGWTLLHSLWEGALIAAALAAVLAAMRSPRLRYAAACAAMLGLLGAFVLTFLRVMPDAVRSAQILQTSAFPASSVRPVAAAGNPSNPGLDAAVPWLAPFWIAGVSMACLWHLAGWVSVRRLRRRGVCCAPEHWQQQLTRLSARLQLSRPVLLLESCLVDAPMVLGHFRPYILMPIGLLAGLPPAQLEAILLHELAHIRRHDYLINVLQRSVEALLFYHPAVWWISRVIRAERENCCDDVVVAMSGDAHEYAVALATLEQNRWSGRQAAVAATGGNLVKRIRRLLYPERPSGAWAPLFAAAILLAGGAAVLAAWPAAAPPQSSAATKKGPPRAEGTPYFRWLAQDAAYIISGEERAAFDGLTSDPQREEFIEQFWLRRDPTPGSAGNEFKEEHYRRIDYANQRFPTASGKPGWQTDRGRIYIVYGPPDEIEAHPSGAPQTPYPFEIWLYRHVEGLGDNLFITFRDRTKAGDYEIAPGNVR
jgi:GWxTD domain-containing protein